MTERTRKTTRSFARMVVWPYKYRNFGDAISLKPKEQSGIFDTRPPFTLESQIVSVQISKSIRQPSGSFQVTLLPTQNFKREIAPGDWVMIFLYNDMSIPLSQMGPEFSDANPDVKTIRDSKNLAMFGNVDRVSRSKQRDETTDKITVRYMVSGRDYGKAFEETVVFFDPYLWESKAIKEVFGYLKNRGLVINGRPSQMVQSIINIFMGDGRYKEGTLDGRDITAIENIASARIRTGVDAKTKGLSKYKNLNQWLIPDALEKVFGEKTRDDRISLNKIVDRKFDYDLPGFKFYGTINENDTVWKYIERSYNDLANLCYFDLDRSGKGIATPAIFLEPRFTSAFFSDPSEQRFLKKYVSMQNAVESPKTYKRNIITLPQSVIKYDDLGNDCQSRVNCIWVEPKSAKDNYTSALVNVDSVKLRGYGLPMVQAESIRRHGLKMFGKGRQIEHVFEEKGSKLLEIGNDLYRAFMGMFYDINIYNHLHETGTIVSVGLIDARLGSILKVPALSKDNPDKLYFVEGYTHTWSFPKQWETEWNVTLGQFNDPKKPFIDAEGYDSGQSDKDFENRYLSKTRIVR